jgi:probable HAF family extracellular repeat protein
MDSHGHIQGRSFVSAVSFGIASFALAAPLLAGTSAQFIPLGSLQPDGTGPVIAYGISADGHVVVGQSNSPSGLQAFRWSDANGIVGLGAFANPQSFLSSGARACSADGSVVVGSSVRPSSMNEDGSPFRWTAATGLVFLGDLGGTEGGVARGVSTDGSIAVGYSSDANFDLEAFRWNASGMPAMTGLGDLAGGVFNSQAAAVSGDGSLVVGLASVSATAYDRSFRWTQASGIQQLGPSAFRAVGLSRDGAFAAGGDTGRAARIEIATGNELVIPHVTIAGLGTDTDTALAANADGSVIVGMQNLSLGNGFFGRAFVWDAQHGTRILEDVLVNDFGLSAELAGWDLNAATAVGDDGMSFAGYGFAPSGEQSAGLVRFGEFPGASFCSVDTVASACPCAQSGALGHGCASSQNPGGALLSASGTSSPDAVVLTTAGELPSALSIFLQGDAQVSAGVAFGDGIRCTGGHLLRLAAKHAVAGSAQYPQSGDPSITARSAALGFAIPSGATRYYQTYYRDPNATFCPPPAGGTFNVTNGIAIVWP